jgi:hypothetical protein
MLDMHAFHKKLATASKPKTPYFKAHADLAKVSLPVLKSITENLGWQIWDSPTPKPVQG